MAHKLPSVSGHPDSLSDFPDVSFPVFLKPEGVTGCILTNDVFPGPSKCNKQADMRGYDAESQLYQHKVVSGQQIVSVCCS